MPLPDARFHAIGETPHPHEQEAIAFARKVLPDRDPFQMWSLFELADPGSGALYEIDLLVLGYGALYVVEVKGGPGRYEGDGVDWWRIPSEGRPQYMDAPYRLANHKAKVLKSRLERHLDDRERCPYVQALVFLSHEDVVLNLRADGRQHVITRKGFERAFTHHEFDGADASRLRRINRPAARDVAKAIRAMGIRPREGKAHAGSYKLGPVLGEGPGFQEREAAHRDNDKMRRRARVYLVPQQTSVERRQQLRRAADRDATLLEEVKEHPGILSLMDYVTDVAMGPTVLFEAFDDGVPLGAFLKRPPELAFTDRIGLIEQIGRALAHCHKKEVWHGALSPEAVLVRRRDGRLETRLQSFQLGAGREVLGTRHRSELTSEPWALYQAPEVKQDPTQLGAASDMFSLGALAYFILTDQPPAAHVTELHERLARDHYLDPGTIKDAIPEDVAQLVRDATHVKPIHRWDGVEEWCNYLIEMATAPPEPEPEEERDPLEARKDDMLGDLRVEGTLGHGATSRVIQVRRGDRSFALKIPLSDEHDERFGREAEVLAKLRHPRVVELIDTLKLAGRSCLLMTLAGDKTLQRHLVEEGTLSLDLASRYGEDLLSALEHIEERQVMHRDIKPANLGVGSPDKKSKHLVLFDFSLALGKTSDVGVGTALYRDPFLALRGSWDYHAERWSAAITLHEMLTGARPQYGDGATPAISEDARLTLSAERFDASVRDRLIAFFERALARKVEDRFTTTEEMRGAWLECFKASLSTDSLPPIPDLTDEQLSTITPETSIAALPLTHQAQNALDRAGVLKAADLLALPSNRLSTIRGVGTKVSLEIALFRERLRAARDEASGARSRSARSTPFFPSYRGADLMVQAALEATLATSLWDAGLRTLAAVAAAPKGQVEALCKRHGVPTKAVREVLKTETERMEPEETPETIEEWLAVLLPAERKPSRFFRSLYGLEAPFDGRLGVTVSQVAQHHGVTPPAIYIQLTKFRELWAKRTGFEPVRAACRAIVESAGGAIALRIAADQLLSRMPFDGSGTRELRRARAAALVSITCELEREEGGLQIMRVDDDTPWVLAHPSLRSIVRRLGEASDELAARDVLATPGEVERTLRAEVEGTSLAPVSLELLTNLAAAASRTAARSSRLEIYPRGMPARRALELCAAAFPSEMLPEHILFRVQTRYPEAERLPSGPELHSLLAPFGFVFDSHNSKYVRPGQSTGTSHGTTLSSLTRTPTSIPTSRPRLGAPTIARKDFDDYLRDTVERRAFRALTVVADRAEQAALQLAAHLGVTPTAFDALLIRHMRKLMQAHGIEEWAVHEADRLGSAGPTWANLRELVTSAAEAVAAELLPPREPLLLIQPGLIARYRLEPFLERLLAASKQDDAAAIFLLLPIHASGGGPPSINGELAIPGVLPSQTILVPSAWLQSDASNAA